MLSSRINHDMDFKLFFFFFLGTMFISVSSILGQFLTEMCKTMLNIKKQLCSMREDFYVFNDCTVPSLVVFFF